MVKLRSPPGFFHRPPETSPAPATGGQILRIFEAGPTGLNLHGRGASSDWTLGCVALDDPAMKELFTAVRVGTVVRILL